MHKLFMYIVYTVYVSCEVHVRIYMYMYVGVVECDL